MAERAADAPTSEVLAFEREILSLDLIDELDPLLRKHWGEIAHYKDIELDPDYQTYLRVEHAGELRCFTARGAGGKLVGYAVFFVRSNVHYRQSKQAVQDVLFLDPSARGAGWRFIDWCDQRLRQEGVQVVYHHVKVAHNFGPTLERMGYEKVDEVYGRRLD